MMAHYQWPDCPAAVREQIDAVSATLSHLLTAQLAGIYLHGSLAMGCFNPHHSDLDLLVVTHKRMDLTTKRQIIEDLLLRSQQPQPIEISFLAHNQLHPWHYPTPFDLHYSETWRDTYTRDLASGEWQLWNEIEHRDPDLAAHITVLNARGHRLMGEPIAAVFPSVPADSFRASITADIHDALESITTAPVYAILNCCRTYAYLRHRHIFSKEEGGRWALQELPDSLCDTVTTALAAYRSEAEEQHFEPDALFAFAEYMRHVFWTP